MKVNKRGFIVAIDGPSGAGKSTVSRKLAEQLGGYLLDTGAMYRGVAFQVAKTKETDTTRIGEMAGAITYDVDLEKSVLLVNGVDLGDKIRTEEVGKVASSISKLKSVRDALTSRQRELGKKLSYKTAVILEGRDIGTVVFPDAPFKFYVTAKPEIRAKRRLKQLEEQGEKNLSLDQILDQITKRDEQDSNRKLAPLKPATDAVVIDTSSLSIDEVIDKMITHIQGS